MARARWLRVVSTSILFTQLVALAQPALALQESEERFNFSETSVGATESVNTLNQTNAVKLRRSPVGSSGAYTSTFGLDVPPGRRGMTPSLALSYSSTDAHRASPVGAGWSLGLPRITRSTRNGTPRLEESGTGPRYASDSTFDSPDGELTATTHGPPSTGAMYAPLRESEPVRYEHLDDVSGGRWVEHSPDGSKRYYGADPFDGQRARVVNELGAFAWLLLREEDAFGNAITYRYHHISDQDRPVRTAAARTPILERVEWGANRLVPSPSLFKLTTELDPQDGPVNMLEGSTMLTSRIRRIVVGPTAGSAFWTYTLAYLQSADSGRPLLTSVTRAAPGESSTSTSFEYSSNSGALAFGPSQNLPAPLDTELVEYKAFGAATPSSTEWSTIDTGFGHEGMASGYQFANFDSVRGTDPIYLPAGISSPQALFNPTRSYLETTQPGTYARLATLGHGLSTTTLFKTLVDMDGDGDLDGVSFPIGYKVGGTNGPSDPLRGVSPIGSCLDSAFWTSCNGQAPSRPSVSNVGDGSCAGLMAGCLTPHVTEPQAADYGAQILHVSRANLRSGSPTTTTQILHDWPLAVSQKTHIVRNTLAPNISRYRGMTLRDFQAPIVDVNADGRPDVVLLKDREHVPPPFEGLDGIFGSGLARAAERTGKTRADIFNFLKVFRGAYTDTEWAARKSLARFGAACEALNLHPANADAFWAQIVHHDILSELFEYAASLEDDEYLSLHSAFVDIHGSSYTACEGVTPPPVMSVRSAPSPFGPAGPMGPGGPWGPGGIITPLPGNPVDPFFGRDPRDWCGTMWGPKALRDWLEQQLIEQIESGGVPGTGFGKSLPKEILKFVPRVYLSDATPERSFRHESEAGGRVGRFAASLQSMLNGGSPDACSGASCVYAPRRNFTTLLMDVNGDGLPDLVHARAPVAVGGHKACVGGHSVALNRGYGWIHQASVSGQIDFEGSQQNWDPLAILKNRDGYCVDMADSGGGRIPISAMTSVDVNGDGLLDWVLAYERRSVGLGGGFSSFTRQVFLNTGRGYRQMTAPSFPIDFALSVYLGSTTGGDAYLPQEEVPAWQDSGRLADIDGDGMVDLVMMGECPNSSPGNPTCPAYAKRGRWYRNLGKTPDVLVTERASTGALTRVAYASGSSPTVVTGQGRAGQVVASITHYPRAYENRPGMGLPSYAKTSFTYGEFVRDVESPEPVGFETVTAVAQSFVDGTATAMITTTDTYDVRETALDVGGAPLPVRFPFRGLRTQTLSYDANGSLATTFDRAARGAGAGLRLEPNGEITRTCINGSCADDQVEVHARDAEGFVVHSSSGPSDGSHVIGARDTRHSLVTYEHRLDDRWQLGLATHEETRGMTETLAGEVWDTPLAIRDATYGTSGEKLSDSVPDPSASDCAAVGASVHTYETDAFGHAWRDTSPSGAVVSRTFDSSNLYVASTSSTVGRFVDGVRQGGDTVLTAHATTDVRSGRTQQSTDPNGNTWTTTYDSRGRPLEERVPGGAVVRTFTYTDTFPVTAFKRTFTGTAAGAYVDAFTYFDGDGQLLSAVEGRGTADVPWTRRSLSRYDGFGRVIESYLPEVLAAPSPDTLDPAAPHESTSYDGFDRVVVSMRADGATTTFHHEPRSTLQVDPRGMQTVRERDAQGQIVRVIRKDETGWPVSEHFVYRDSLGAVVRLYDGDGNSRHIQRDGAGRLSRYDLPHAPGATAPTTLVCYDVAGRPSQVATPGGKTVWTAHDELGRVVSLEGMDAEGVLSRRTTDYDDPAATHNALGRVSVTRDGSGVRHHTYDAFSRPRQQTFEPSAALSTGLVGVAPLYTTTYNYAPLGALQSVQLTGLAQPLNVQYVRDAAGRPRQLRSGPRTLVSGVDFDAHERIVQTRLGNGTRIDRVFDPLSGVLRSITNGVTGGAVLEHVDYDYDPSDNVTLESRSQGGVLTTQKTHAFDALDRLVASELWMNGVNSQQGFAYSAGGNLVYASGLTYSYGEGANTQAATAIELGTQRERTLTYGTDGEVVSDDALDPGTGLTVHRAHQTDGLGCLRSVEDPFHATELFCGPTGDVVGRRTTDVATGIVDARIDIGGIGELRPKDGIFLARIPLGGAASVEEAYDLTTGSLDIAKSAYLLSDVRGSTLSRLGYSGQASSHEAEYDAWGAAVGISAKPTPTHAYTSREPDPGTGLYHYGPRTYDPNLRRWLSPDPLLWLVPERQVAWGEQLNLYGYASNNPARWTDLSGFEHNRWRSLAEFAGSIAVGVVASFTPADLPRDSGGEYAKEHNVGVGLGAMLGGALQMRGGGETAVRGGMVAVASDGLAIVPAGAVAAAGAAMAAHGAAVASAGLQQVSSEMHGPQRGTTSDSPRTDGARETTQGAPSEAPKTNGPSEPKGPTFDRAREEAFSKAGMTDPSKVEFSKVDPTTGTVVEFKGPGGAKVGYDGPHPGTPGPLHDQQHISIQSAGKRTGGATRENIPYSGPQHPSRPGRQ